MVIARPNTSAPAVRCAAPPHPGVASHVRALSTSEFLPSAFQLWNQLRPAVEDRQDLVFFGRGQAHRHAANTKIAVTPQYGQILRRAVQGYQSWPSAAAEWFTARTDRRNAPAGPVTRQSHHRA